MAAGRTGDGIREAIERETRARPELAQLDAELAAQSARRAEDRGPAPPDQRAQDIELDMVELENQIERRFTDFNRRWPAESGGLDATLASADDYFAKLARLEADGLPRYEERFLPLLREQSDQDLTLLSHRLDQERSAMETRLELVNESVLSADFNPGTRRLVLPDQLGHGQNAALA